MEAQENHGVCEVRDMTYGQYIGFVLFFGAFCFAIKIAEMLVATLFVF
ncbi:hypothetical protein ACFL2D_02570 [Patescibacteria group bacterium]